MALDPALALLTILVSLPLVGALVVMSVGAKRESLGRWLAVACAGAAVALASRALWVEPAPELRSWIPTAGVSFHLGISGQNALLVLWVALATMATLVATRPAARTAAKLLLLEAATVGLLLAQDVFLVLACLGGVMIATAWLADGTKRVLVYGLAASAVLSGWFAHVYQTVYSQTGFPSTELARWHALVLFPSEERSLFLVGVLGAAFWVPVFVAAMKQAPRAHRLGLFAVAGPVVSDFLLRVLVPMSPRGADASTGWMIAIAMALAASAWLARGWAQMAVGYYGLVLLGAFAFPRDAVVSTEIIVLAIAIGFFGLELVGPRRLLWLGVAFLVALGVAGVLVPAWSGEPTWAIVATATFALMMFRFITLARDHSGATELAWP